MSIFPTGPTEGDRFQSGGFEWEWDGRRWVGVGVAGGGEGTITAVNAGTGLGGGGPAGPVTLYLADTPVMPGSYTNTNLTVDQQGRILAAADGAGGGTDGGAVGGALIRGELGTYARGTHFEGSGQPSLQEFLDANINGRWFEPRTGGAVNLIIEAGNIARTGTVTIRNVFMQGLTLIVQTQAQFAGAFTISGFTGSLDIGGTGAWGNATNFATHVNVQNVSGTVRLAGGSSTRRFNDVSFFGCPDARLDAGATDTLQIAGTLTAANSGVRLDGQIGSSHSYNLTNLDGGSRLEISSSLGSGAVNLGSGGRRQGWILDWRAGNALDTFARGAGGAITGGDVSLLGGIATVTHLQRRPVLDVTPGAGFGLMWTATGWAPGQFLRTGDWIAANHSTVTPITYTHQGATHDLGASTVQGALQNLFQWFITDVQPPPEPPPQQTFHSITPSSLTFQTSVPSGTVVTTFSVALTPADPPFSGTLALTSGTGFQIQGMNLVTVGTLAAGQHNITVTATQSGIAGSFVQGFQLTATEAGEIPPLPSPPAGQVAVDLSWIANGIRLNDQTDSTSTNIPFAQTRIVSAVARITTANLTAVNGTLGHYRDGDPAGTDISGPFALNQTGLINITGISTQIFARQTSPFTIFYCRSPTGQPITSVGTVRIFAEDAAGGGGGTVPALPAVPAGQIGIDSSWVIGGGTVGDQTMPSTSNIPQNCNIVRAVVRITGSDTVASAAAVRWISAASGAATTMSNLLPLNQAPALVDATGLNTTQVIAAGDRVYWGVMSEGILNVNSVATARIYLQPVSNPTGEWPEPVTGRMYYIAANGSNTNPGTKGEPWATVEQVNGHAKQAGDAFMFRSTDTFTGLGIRNIGNSGTASAPIFYRSYGPDNSRATIRPGTGTISGSGMTGGLRDCGVYVRNSSHVHVSDLIIIGTNSRDGYNTGVLFESTNLPATPYVGNRITNVNASQCGRRGITVATSMDQPPSTVACFDDIVIDRCVVHSSNDGIFACGKTRVGEITNIRVTNCVAHNNQGGWVNVVDFDRFVSGNGIVMGCVDGGLIENCVAHSNGTESNDGPVGIWMYDSNAVVIRYCEAYSNYSNHTDGGGFNIDGGATNCICEYCYSHDNRGPGYQYWIYVDSPYTGDNIVRFCVSQNDMTDGSYASGCLHFGSSDPKVGYYGKCTFHNVVVYQSRSREIVRQTTDWGARVPGDFFNCIFISAGASRFISNGNSQYMRFNGNNWVGSAQFNWHGTNYSTVAAWRGGTGSPETLAGADTSRTWAHGLNNAGNGGTMAPAGQPVTPAMFHAWQPYQLTSGSQNRGAGLNIQQDFSLNPGPQDMFGNPIQATALSIGAHSPA